MTPHESPARRSIRANTGWHAGSGPVCRPVTSGDLGALRITSNLTRPNRDRAADLLADVRRVRDVGQANEPEQPIADDVFDEADEVTIHAAIDGIRRMLGAPR